MKIFIDSANIGEIKEAKKTGLLDGITTNPSLIAREKKRTNKKFKDIVQDIAIMVPDKPISVEVLSTETDKMLEEGRELNTLSENIVVKLPCIKESLSALQELSSEGIKTNLTLCFSPLQAWLVAKSGATYVSPFIGRLDDIGQEGINLIADIKQIYHNYQFPTEILVASVRNPVHVLNSARIGADVVTLPFSVINQLMEHPKTKDGVEKFLADARSCSQDNNK